MTVYGFMLDQLPLIAANGGTISLNLILLWLKLDDTARRRRRNRGKAPGETLGR